MPTPGGGAGGDDASSLWDDLGLPEPAFLDESRAPSVDRDLIRRFVRRELNEASAKDVTRHIVMFRSWSDAHLQIVREEAAASREQA